MKKTIILLIAVLLFNCTDEKKEKEKEALLLQKESMELTLLDSSKTNRQVAKNLMKKAIEIAPHLTSLYSTKANLDLLDQDIEEATKAIEKALELKPDMAEYWIQKGEIQLVSKDTIAAHKSFEQAIVFYDERIEKNMDADSNLFDKWIAKTLIDKDIQRNTTSLRADLETKTSLAKDQIDSKISLFTLLVNR